MRIQSIHTYKVLQHIKHFNAYTIILIYSLLDVPRHTQKCALLQSPQCGDNNKTKRDLKKSYLHFKITLPTFLLFRTFL